MSKPLADLRVAVTRTAEQAGSLRDALATQGALVYEYPLIRIQPPKDLSLVKSAIARLEQYDWLVFTSANGVDRFWTAVQEAKRDPHDFSGQVLAIGTATAQALAKWGMAAAAVPGEFRAEAALEHMLAAGVQGRRVLVARAVQGRDVIPTGLRQAGALVDVAPVYETVADPVGGVQLCGALRAGGLDVLTFTSSSTVHSFMQSAGEQAAALVQPVVVACIGPVTADTARKAGMQVAVTAEEYTGPGLAHALVRYVQSLAKSQ